MVGASQVRLALSWLQAFLAGTRSTISRVVGVRKWRGPAQVSITWGASPRDIGAVLRIRGRLVAWLADEIRCEAAMGAWAKISRRACCSTSSVGDWL